MKNLKNFMKENKIETVKEAKSALEDGAALHVLGFDESPESIAEVEALHAEACEVLKGEAK